MFELPLFKVEEGKKNTHTYEIKWDKQFCCNSNSSIYINLNNKIIDGFYPTIQIDNNIKTHLLKDNNKILLPKDWKTIKLSIIYDGSILSTPEQTSFLIKFIFETNCNNQLKLTDFLIPILLIKPLNLKSTILQNITKFNAKDGKIKWSSWGCEPPYLTKFYKKINNNWEIQNQIQLNNPYDEHIESNLDIGDYKITSESLISSNDNCGVDCGIKENYITLIQPQILNAKLNSHLIYGDCYNLCLQICENEQTKFKNCTQTCVNEVWNITNDNVNDGKISASIISGNPPYQYLWNGPFTEENTALLEINNLNINKLPNNIITYDKSGELGLKNGDVYGLSKGWYGLKIIDDTNQEWTGVIELTSPPLPKLNLIRKNDTSKPNEKDGYVEIQIDGETPSYLFNLEKLNNNIFVNPDWEVKINKKSTTLSFDNLEKGYYKATIKDCAKQEVQLLFEIIEPEPLIVEVITKNCCDPDCLCDPNNIQINPNIKELIDCNDDTAIVEYNIYKIDDKYFGVQPYNNPQFTILFQYDKGGSTNWELQEKNGIPNSCGNCLGSYLFTNFKDWFINFTKFTENLYKLSGVLLKQDIQEFDTYFNVKLYFDRNKSLPFNCNQTFQFYYVLKDNNQVINQDEITNNTTTMNLDTITCPPELKNKSKLEIDLSQIDLLKYNVISLTSLEDNSLCTSIQPFEWTFNGYNLDTELNDWVNTINQDSNDIITASKQGMKLILTWDEQLETCCNNEINWKALEISFGHITEILSELNFNTPITCCKEQSGNKQIVLPSIEPIQNIFCEECPTIEPCTKTENSGGSIQVNILSGNPPYNIELQSKLPLISTHLTTTNFKGLNKGFYLLSVSDDKGLNYREQVQIKAPLPLDELIEIEVINTTECNGYGEIKVIHKKDPNADQCYDCLYDYFWNTGENSTYIVKKAGTYTLTIIPRQPCCQTPIQKIVKIEEPICLEIETKILIDQISYCNSNQLGSAGVEIKQGNGGYSYKWDTKCLCELKASDNLILKNTFNENGFRNNLLDGSYIITVIDDKGQCACSNVIIIKKPNELCIIPKTNQNSSVSTYQATDGKIEISISSNPKLRGNGDIKFELYEVDNCADTPCGTNCDTEINSKLGSLQSKILTQTDIKIGNTFILFDNLKPSKYLIRAIDQTECIISNCLCYTINDKPNPCLQNGPYITQIQTEPDIIQIKAGEIKNFTIDIDLKRFECCFNDGQADLLYEKAEYTIFQYPIISFNTILVNNHGGATIIENGKKLILENPFILNTDEGKSQIVSIQLNYNGKEINDDRIILLGTKPCFPDIYIPLQIDVCCKSGCCEDNTCCPEEIPTCCCDGVYKDGPNKGKLKKDIICADPNHILFKTCCNCKDLETRNPNALKGQFGLCKNPNNLIDPFYKDCCDCKDLNLSDLLLQCQNNPNAPHLTDCCDCKNPLNIELRKEICKNSNHPDYSNCCQCNDPLLPPDIKDIITNRVCSNPSPSDIINPDSDYNKCCNCKDWSDEIRTTICSSGPANPAYYKTYIENGIQKPCCSCQDWSLIVKKSICGSGLPGSDDTYTDGALQKRCCDCKDPEVATEMQNRVCIDANIGTSEFNRCCNCSSWSPTKKLEICSNPSHPEFNSTYIDPISGLTLKCCCTEITKQEVNGWQKYPCCQTLECGQGNNKTCCRCEDIDPTIISLLCSAADYSQVSLTGISISEEEYNKYKLECCQCCDDNKPIDSRELKSDKLTWPFPSIGQGGIPFDAYSTTTQQGKFVFDLPIPCCKNTNNTTEQLIIKESSIKGFSIPNGEGLIPINPTQNIDTINNYELVIQYNKFDNIEAKKLEDSGGKVQLKIGSPNCCFEYNVKLDLAICCKQDVNHTGDLPATICRPRYNVKKYYVGEKAGRITFIFSNSYHGDTFRIRYRGQIVAMVQMAKARKDNNIINCWTPDNYINDMYNKWQTFNDNQKKQAHDGYVVTTNGIGTFPDSGVSALAIFSDNNYINSINNIETNFVNNNNLPNNSISWLGRQRDRAVGDGRIGFNYNPDPGFYEIEIEMITYSPINFYALYCPCQYEDVNKYKQDNPSCSFNDICTNGSTCIDPTNQKQSGMSLPTLSGRRDCQNKEPQCPQHILPNSTENFITKSGANESNRLIKYSDKIFKRFNPIENYFAMWEYHKSGNTNIIPNNPNRKTQQGMIDNNINDQYLGTFQPNICLSSSSTINSGCGMQGPPFCYSCNAWTEQNNFTTQNLGNGYYCIDPKYTLKYALYGNYDNSPDGRRFTLEYLLWAGSIPYLTISSLDKKCFSCNQSGTTYSISNYTVDYPDYAVNSSSKLPYELKSGQYFYDYENPNNICGTTAYYTDKDGNLAGYYDFKTNQFIKTTTPPNCASV